MRLLVILCSTIYLTSGLHLSVNERRDSKWDEMIHHEYHGPPAPLSKDGRVVDTPEVAKAKENHLLIVAETAAELAKKMSEAKAKAENQEGSKTVVASIQMTPEIMAMLMSAIAQEQKTEGEQQKKNQEKPLEKDESPIILFEPQQLRQPELRMLRILEETKPIYEIEANNEIGEGHPIAILQKNYEGPLAPLGKDGRVVDTSEVKLAKDLHLSAYKELAELSKSKEDQQEGKKSDEWIPIWPETTPESNKRIYLPPVHLLWPTEGPIRYTGPEAPIDNVGRVIDTTEVEKAKVEHKKAHEHAKAIAKRHPPKPEDNFL